MKDLSPAHFLPDPPRYDSPRGAGMREFPSRLAISRPREGVAGGCGWSVNRLAR